jgi:glucose-6-phosphate isomerase
MATKLRTPTERRAWQARTAHHRKVPELHRRDLFAADPGPAERMTAEAVGLVLDYSKNRISIRGYRKLKGGS